MADTTKLNSQIEKNIFNKLVEPEIINHINKITDGMAGCSLVINYTVDGKEQVIDIPFHINIDNIVTEQSSTVSIDNIFIVPSCKPITYRWRD